MHLKLRPVLRFADGSVENEYNPHDNNYTYVHSLNVGRRQKYLQYSARMFDGVLRKKDSSLILKSGRVTSWGCAVPLTGCLTSLF
jgi:hypothetical protein